jgi:hypothetical protein
MCGKVNRVVFLSPVFFLKLIGTPRLTLNLDALDSTVVAIVNPRNQKIIL